MEGLFRGTDMEFPTAYFSPEGSLNFTVFTIQNGTWKIGIIPSAPPFSASGTYSLPTNTLTGVLGRAANLRGASGSESPRCRVVMIRI